MPFLSYIDSFVAKTETPDNPIPRSFTIKGLTEIAGDLVECKLCPVRAIRDCLDRLKLEVLTIDFCSVLNPSRPPNML